VSVDVGRIRHANQQTVLVTLEHQRAQSARLDFGQGFYGLGLQLDAAQIEVLDLEALGEELVKLRLFNGADLGQCATELVAGTFL